MRQERQEHKHSTNLLRVRKREGNRQEKKEQRLETYVISLFLGKISIS